MSNTISTLGDAGVQKTLSGAAYGASITTAAGGAISVNDMALIAGIVFAALTFVVNLIYQSRKDKREAQLNKLRQEEIRQRMADAVADERAKAIEASPDAS